MFRKGKKTLKEFMITTYIKGAMKLELNSDGGKVNYKTFLGALVFAFIFCLPDGILEVIKTLYALFKLEQFYDPKVNLTPFYIAVCSGILCFVLMLFIFDRQTKVKEAIEEISLDNSDNK